MKTKALFKKKEICFKIVDEEKGDLQPKSNDGLQIMKTYASGYMHILCCVHIYIDTHKYARIDVYKRYFFTISQNINSSILSYLTKNYLPFILSHIHSFPALSFQPQAL